MLSTSPFSSRTKAAPSARSSSSSSESGARNPTQERRRLISFRGRSTFVARSLRMGRVHGNVRDKAGPAITLRRRKNGPKYAGHRQPWQLYSPKCVEGAFSEVRRHGVLRSSVPVATAKTVHLGDT